MYHEHTYNSKNPLARFSHRSRFSKGVNIVLRHNFNDILDYGAGDNKFLIELQSKQSNANLHAFEPVMENKAIQDITLYTELEELENKKFDLITCFETLEHFNPEEEEQIIKRFHALLNDGGIVIISVPIEIGLPSLIKNFRRVKKWDLKNIKNTFRCFLGMNIPEVRNRSGYIPSHLGFNHNKLEKILIKYFTLEKKETSPLSGLPPHLNSQVFYTLIK